MTAPVVAGSATTVTTDTNVTGFTVNLPASIAAGDLLVAFLAEYNSPNTMGIPTGWFPLSTGMAGSTGWWYGDGNERAAVAYRWADGTETSTQAWTVNAGGGSAVSVVVLRVTGAGGLAISQGAAPGSTTAPDASNCQGAWPSTVDTLWLTAVGWRDASSVSSDPSGYANRVTAGTGSSGQMTCAVSRKSNTANSENAGAWTLSGARFSTAVTVGVRDGSGGGASGTRVTGYAT